jgi:hypothetical protein
VCWDIDANADRDVICWMNVILDTTVDTRIFLKRVDFRCDESPVMFSLEKNNLE